MIQYHCALCFCSRYHHNCRNYFPSVLAFTNIYSWMPLLCLRLNRWVSRPTCQWLASSTGESPNILHTTFSALEKVMTAVVMLLLHQKYPDSSSGMTVLLLNLFTSWKQFIYSSLLVLIFQFHFESSRHAFSNWKLLLNMYAYRIIRERKCWWIITFVINQLPMQM